MNYSDGLFTQAFKELREGIAAQGGVIAKGAAPANKKEDPKAKGGEAKGANTSDEERVKQALYDIRYRSKRENVPVAQAMTDYLKHSGSLGPKARAELKKKLMGEEFEQVDEALTGERYKKAVKKPGGTAYSRMVSADPKKRATRGGRGGESDFGAGDRGSGNKAARRSGTYKEYDVNEAKKMKGEDPCWDGYEMVGKKKKGGKEVPNCVPKEETDAMLQKQQLQLNRKKLQQQTKAVQKKQPTDMSMKEDVSTEELVHLYNILENDQMAYMHDVAQARVEEILEAQQEKISSTQKKGPSGDTLYKVRVVNNDGRSEVRYASRAKIAELRGNSNIKSVEITGYGEPNNYSDKSDKKKELDPVGKEDGDVDNDGDKDKSDKYLMNRRKAVGKAIAAKEEFSSVLDDLTDLEVALLSDSMIDEIVEEVIFECLEDGYDIDLVEEVICESLDASMAVIMEVNPYAAAGSKEARAYNKSANASKRSKDRAEKVAQIKSAVKSKAAEVGSAVKSAAKTTGSMAKTAAKKAGNAAATGAGAVAGAAAGAGKEMGSSFKKGFKAGYKATTKSADGGGEKKPGILSRIKNKVKSAVGKAARGVATRMGEEVESLGK